MRTSVRRSVSGTNIAINYDNVLFFGTLSFLSQAMTNSSGSLLTKRSDLTCAAAIRSKALQLLLAAISFASANAQANADRNTIVLGVSTPLTGSESAPESDYLAGAIFGRPVNLCVMDDAGKVDATAANT